MSLLFGKLIQQFFQHLHTGHEVQAPYNPLATESKRLKH
jgi:hypothetical protein